MSIDWLALMECGRLFNTFPAATIKWFIVPFVDQVVRKNEFSSRIKCM